MAYCPAPADVSRFFDACLVFKNWPMFLEGAWTSLHLTVLALVFGFAIALPTGLALARRHPVFEKPARAYVYLFRGTPLLVQTYLIYYGLAQFDLVKASWFWRTPGFAPDACMSYWWPSLRPDWLVFREREACLEHFWPSFRSAWFCAVLAFSLNSGAYAAEILRGAFQATPKGELEAARALGMSERKIFWRILLPSALRRALPQYGNEVVFMLHGTAIVSVITIQDILGAGRTLNNRYYVAYEGLLTAAAVYMLITFLIVRGIRRTERRYMRHLIRSGG